MLSGDLKSLLVGTIPSLIVQHMTQGRFWKERAPLKEARIVAFGVSKNEQKIFITGGLGHDVWMNCCEVYNLATNE